MTPAETLTLATYFFVLIILAVYGWHRYYLVYLYLRHRNHGPKTGPQLDPLPVVTLQLPLYNEMYVADRLIESVRTDVRNIDDFMARLAVCRLYSAALCELANYAVGPARRSEDGDFLFAHRLSPPRDGDTWLAADPWGTTVRIRAN